MATAINDILGGLEASEENGMIVSMKRTVLVSDISATTPQEAVLEVLAAAPGVHTGLQVGASPMYVVKRSMRIGKDKNQSEVTLEYENALMGGDSSGDEAPFSSYSGGTAMQQITSQVDREGNALSVTYNNTTVPVEIQVDEAHGELSIEMVEFTKAPGALQREWENKISSTAWQGSPPFTWRCTSVSWKMRNHEDSSWDFTYQFQYKRGTWQPSGVYIDPTTNQQPPDWKEAGAFVGVPWYDLKDFNAKFPVR